MPIAYEPEKFWGVVFARRGSAVPHVIGRTLTLTCIAGIVITLHRFYPSSMAGFDGTTLLPFQMMVAFVMGFRLNGAFNKFEKANNAVLDMHAITRKIMNRLMCYCARSPQLDDTLIRVRRLLVLSCVLVKKHVRVEKSFYFEQRCGLITPQELKAMTKTPMVVASMPGGDGASATYPARNWPSVAFYNVQREVVKLFRDGHLPSSPHASGLDALVDQLSDTLEQVELIGLTIAPLPYAQVTRWITLAFLIFLPFESAVRCRHCVLRPHTPTRALSPAPQAPSRPLPPLHLAHSPEAQPHQPNAFPRQAKTWSRYDTDRSSILRELDLDAGDDEAGDAVEAHMLWVRFQIYLLTAVLAFITNLVYFAIDEVATQLETPFGRDENDIDFERMLRRIDKHTAAQLALRLGRPVPHFDLYPDVHNFNALVDPASSIDQPPPSLVARAYRCTMGRLLSSITTGIAIAGDNDPTYYLGIESARIEAEKTAAAEAAAAKQEQQSFARAKVWQAVSGAARANSSAEASGMHKLVSRARLHQARDEMRANRDHDDHTPAVGLLAVLICGMSLEDVTDEMVLATTRIQAHYRGKVCRRQQQAAMAGEFRNENM